MERNVWVEPVNGFLSLLFVGSFALGAGLILWHTAFGNNPVERLFVSQATLQTLSQ